MESKEKVAKIKEILKGKKALDFSILKIENESVLADYFIVATGINSEHVKILADEVELKMEELGMSLHACEGRASNLWVLLDYKDIVVHIFDREATELYNLKVFGMNKSLLVRN